MSSAEAVVHVTNSSTEYENVTAVLIEETRAVGNIKCGMMKFMLFQRLPLLHGGQSILPQRSAKRFHKTWNVIVCATRVELPCKAWQ